MRTVHQIVGTGCVHSANRPDPSLGQGTRNDIRVHAVIIFAQNAKVLHAEFNGDRTGTRSNATLT
jgi:hypothetical protein